MILFGSSFLVYNLAAFASDPLAELRLSNDDSAQQQIAALTRQLNLDVPPLVMVCQFNPNWPMQFRSQFAWF
jgi:peptide/nickel transport system permease protein